MKTILITGAGGAPALNFTRSLRRAPEAFRLIGVDCDKFNLQRAETDEAFLIPPAHDRDYLAVLRDIIKETGAEFLHMQNDVEIATVSAHRDELPIKMFLPNTETVALCQNKLESSKRWRRCRLPQPRTRAIHDEEDLRCAFDGLGSRLWIRAVRGAAGKGSLLVGDYDIAKSWIDFHKGWGFFMAAEYLSPQSVTWQSVWRQGRLIAAQSRKRVYWEFSDRAPSGITGVTGAGVTVRDGTVDTVAQKAIAAVDGKPHGIFSVDLTYDKKGVPNPTEINIGRFFTTHEFFTQAGLNMPYLYVKIAFGEAYPKPPRRINPLPAGLVWIRGMDCTPILTSMKNIDRCEQALIERRKALA